MNTHKSLLLNILGKRIREFRTKLGISQEELAFKAGMDRTYISGVERGIRNPTYTSLATIASALESNVSDLLINIESLSTEQFPKD
jgi:transcriptional regulator with XRE-family HTH domain